MRSGYTFRYLSHRCLKLIPRLEVALYQAVINRKKFATADAAISVRRTTFSDKLAINTERVQLVSSAPTTVYS